MFSFEYLRLARRIKISISGLKIQIFFLSFIFINIPISNHVFTTNSSHKPLLQTSVPNSLPKPQPQTHPTNFCLTNSFSNFTPPHSQKVAEVVPCVWIIVWLALACTFTVVVFMTLIRFHFHYYLSSLSI